MSVEDVKQKILELIKTRSVISKRELSAIIENKEDLDKAIFELISKNIIFEINILGGNYYGIKNSKNR